MCQVGEDYGEPAPGEPPPAPRPSREQKCVKCKEAQPVVVIRAGDAFCRCSWRGLGGLRPAPWSGRFLRA
ncbi:CTU2 isoform 3 [Pan troglodytes]|uniref:CTU2 isoform 3 n=1 Tax=Pan troglodytes TaxID=9598 RepID=A0A2J8IWG7_PANTR|nr:CTU2 isoform 3 [Pan troglodytes]